MPSYKISAHNPGYAPFVVATAKSARDGIAAYREALRSFTDVFLADEHGAITESVLFSRAQEEGEQPKPGHKLTEPQIERFGRSRYQ